ncbi:MAG: hypothetical protein AB7O73_03935 [Bacteroidia bacterium]
MKGIRLLVLIVLLLNLDFFASDRKPRSDKGKTHKHSAEYNLKHGIKNSSSRSSTLNTNEKIGLSIGAVLVVGFVVVYFIHENRRVKRRWKSKQ